MSQNEEFTQAEPLQGNLPSAPALDLPPVNLPAVLPPKVKGKAKGKVTDAPLILRSPQKWQASDKGFLAPARNLFQILSWKRPFESDAEEEFARTFLDPLGCEQDAFRNRILRIGKAPVLWSSHIDTCHHQGGYQRLEIWEDSKTNLNYLQVLKGDGNCLGADDGTGVWLMIEMIKAKREGLYVFHRGEEVGCRGSKWIAKETPELLTGIDYAIAFDRRDFTNTITFQGGNRCASDEFAKALSEKIHPSYEPDPSGVYTDTASYMTLIPECTNLSVGYQGQHGPLERQYLGFALSLRERVLALDVTGLPVKRDHTKVESRYQSSGRTRGNHYSQDDWRNGVWNNEQQRFVPKSPKIVGIKGLTQWKTDKIGEDLGKTFYQLIRENASDVLQLLLTKGVTRDDVLEKIHGTNDFYAYLTALDEISDREKKH